MIKDDARSALPPDRNVPRKSHSPAGPRRTARRLAAVALAAVGLSLAGAAAAQAHVQVIPDQTAAGTEITKLTFRVPTESEKAGTSKVQISLPTDTPLAEVLAEPLSGWTVTVTEGKLPKPVTLDGTKLTEAPRTVTFTATKGHAVGPGQFQEFALSAGPIPDDATVLSFPVTQTYSDGTVVKWNQPQPAGADEPEHPLPSFTVTAAVPEDGADATATPEPTTTSSVAATGDPVALQALENLGTDSHDSTARILGAVGIFVGALGVLTGVFFGLAGRRRRP